jgi:CRP-like cAMP-binding protein
LKQNKPFCTDAQWIGRSDCVHCDVRGTMLFSELSQNDLEGLLMPIDNMQLPAKGLLYHEGETGQSVYTVRRGLLRLVHNFPNGTRRIARLLKPGSVAGMELLVNSHYHLTAEAVNDTDLCRIPVDVLHQIERKNPVLHEALMRRWQKSLDEADEVIIQLSTGSAPARVARFLLHVVSDIQRNECQFLAREDLAALVGLTVETVSRVFAEFKRNGWVQEEARCISIDRANIERIAND